ncbi:MAG: hypothetical protein GXC94_02205 [Comamonadaceae bacterium]|nr:hypothetical protein [Comamonadaceae bacterium]
MIRSILNHFFPSVDSLTASIRKTVDRLEAHSAKSHDKASRIEHRAAEFLSKAKEVHAGSLAIADEVTAEARRAGAQARKLRALLA